MNNRGNNSFPKLVTLLAIVGVIMGFGETVDVQERVKGVLGLRTKEVEEVQVVLVGDVMLGRSVNANSVRRDNFDWPFEEVKEELQEADLLVGNLESPIVDNCPVVNSGMVFCGDKRAIDGLLAAGFDGLGLANNHIMNYGEWGFDQTNESLSVAGVTAVTKDDLWERDVLGIRMGVMVLDDISSELDLEKVVEEVEVNAGKVDLLVGLIHWGVEYKGEPSLRQQELGRALVDAGMRVVVGSHPHWVQPVEEYNDGLIFYSLGNFVFDQMWSEETRKGIAVNLKLKEVSDGRVELDYELWKSMIYDYGQVRWEKE